MESESEESEVRFGDSESEMDYEMTNSHGKKRKAKREVRRKVKKEVKRAVNRELRKKFAKNEAVKKGKVKERGRSGRGRAEGKIQS